MTGRLKRLRTHEVGLALTFMLSGALLALLLGNLCSAEVGMVVAALLWLP